MKNRYPILLLCLSFGCPRAQEPTVDESALNHTLHHDPVSGTSFSVADPLTLDDACTDDRFLGIRTGATCPLPGASPNGVWSRAPLFDHTIGAVPAGLSTYCSYIWQPAAVGMAPDISVLPSDGGRIWSDWLSRDCNVVSALSNSFVEANRATLESAFYEQVDRLSPLPLANAPLANVRVLVADSAINAHPPHPSVGRLAHGQAISVILNQLTCPRPNDPTSACTGGTASALALPLENTVNGLVRNETQGGYFGSLGDLAAAIYDGARVLDGTSEQTIINLSVAWDPAFGGDYTHSPSELDVPLRAVHTALEYASCAGMLVVGAAGNKGGGATDTGPMYPAAWEQKDAPTAARCTALGIASSPPNSTTNYRPLLFAAGGVDGADRPLAIARAQGNARLVAPASHAVASDPVTSIDPMTGTSVAAAVVSAAATLIWSYNPGLSPFDVMENVYQSAVDLGETADFCHSATCGTKRRVSICRAVERACTLQGGCHSTFVCGPAQRDATPSGLVVPAPAILTPVDGALANINYDVGPPCNTELWTDHHPDANPCLSEQYYTKHAIPWVEPQPDVDPCLVCFHKPGYVTFEINEKLEGDVTSPTIDIVYLSGEKTTIKLPIEDSLTPGEAYEVHDLDFDDSQIKTAEIRFLIDGKESTASPLLPLE